MYNVLYVFTGLYGTANLIIIINIPAEKSQFENVCQPIAIAIDIVLLPEVTHCVMSHNAFT